MSVYIYEEPGSITTNWHDGGSVTIITDRDPNETWHDYLSAIAAKHPSNAAYLDASKIIQTLPEPTRVVEASGDEETVYVFPDAGCC